MITIPTERVRIEQKIIWNDFEMPLLTSLRTGAPGLADSADGAVLDVLPVNIIEQKLHLDEATEITKRDSK